MKVLVIFGTRPEAIKMAPVVRELVDRSEDSNVRCLTCVTGQHREMLDQVMRMFNVTPDIDLNLMQRNQTLASLSSRAIIRITSVLRRERPDVVLVQGDTTTAMVAALAAFYERITIGHVEAGLRTGDRYSPFPEEVNRRIVTTLATFHFAPTPSAVRNLKNEGITSRVFLTGNTVIDALLWVVGRVPSPETLSILKSIGLYSGADKSSPANKKAILVTAHRRENFGKPLEDICRALITLVKRHPDVRIIYPVHMNPNVREPVNRILSGYERIYLVEPLSYECFVHVMNRVHLVITDSGGVQEEAPALGKPVLVVRNDTERPEAVEAGCAKLVGTDQERILQEVESLLQDNAAYELMAHVASPYGDGHAAERIAGTLTSALRIAPEHLLWSEGCLLPVSQ